MKWKKTHSTGDGIHDDRNNFYLAVVAETAKRNLPGKQLNPPAKLNQTKSRN